MIRRTLKGLWKRMFGKASRPGNQNQADERLANIRPITTGLRLEIKVPAGGRRETSVSQVIWVSAAGSPRPAKALTVLLNPN